MTFKLDGPLDAIALIDRTILSEQRTMKVECKECPFKRERQGRPFLDAPRMEGIKMSILMGRRFPCHETTSATQDIDDGPSKGNWHPHHRQCRGALEWAKGFCAEHNHPLEILNGCKIE
jgi:hypothetical protein